ncbi:MAG: hypothetical protein JWR26_3200 [Pedosphaera sp.]|nr:hypothetical protein [Pedosphaera sp.]
MFVLLSVGALSLMRIYGKDSSRNIPVLGDENGTRISTCFQYLSSRRSKFANEPAAPSFNRLAIHFKHIVVSKRPYSGRAQAPAAPVRYDGGQSARPSAPASISCRISCRPNTSRARVSAPAGLSLENGGMGHFQLYSGEPLCYKIFTVDEKKL